MNKTVKYIAIALGALIALLLAAVVILAATFDPNEYKPQIVRLVQEKTQRTLTIPGEIELSFFPRLGVDLGKVSISEKNSEAVFASVDRAQVSLALLPLLAKKAVVDRVDIEGLRANIVRHKDGRSNYDDLLGDEKKEEQDDGQQILFDIDSIHLGNAHLVYDDRQQGRRFEIADLDLDTGKIADGVPSKLALSAHVKGNQPAVDARVALDSGFTLHLDEQRYVLDDLDAQIKGALAGFTDLVLKAAGDADLKPQDKRFALDDIALAFSGRRAQQAIDAKFSIPKLAITDTQVSGGKLSGEAKIAEGARTVTASFSVPSFEGSPQAFKLPALSIDATVRDGELDASAKLSGALAGDIDKLLFTSPQLALTLSGKQGTTAINGKLITPLTANLKAQAIELPQLAADFTLPNPGGGTLHFKAGGNASANLGKQNASASLKGSLDQSAFNAKLGLSDFSPLAYTFDIGIDQLDLDRYRTKPAGDAAKTPPQPKAEGKAAPEQPMDLSALRDLRANGSVRVGSLKVANIKSSNVRFDLRAAGGKLDIEPLVANLYGGSVAGGLSVAAEKTPRFAVRQNLTGINIGPLLQDAVGKAQVEGRGNVRLDVTSRGATFDQIKKALDGSARLELRDGAIRGVNIAQAVRNAKAKIGEIRGKEPEQAGTASADEKTDFSEMSASFRIANGVAHNDDLNLKSPLVRVGGAGEINLGAGRLDYLVKATVVSTLKGQGGPELEALKGLTIPVRLTGPFDAIAWRIDFAGLASELARQKLEGKREELKSKAEKSLEEQKGKLEEKLQERLKGLLGR